MKGKTPVNVGASVRARLLKISKERHVDFTLMLVNYAAERFLYRLSRSSRRAQFVLKGAMLFAVRINEPYRTTRDLDLLGTSNLSESAIEEAVREIAATPAYDDGVRFDLSTLQIVSIRDESRYGGLRVILLAHLDGARIHVQIDVGFGDVVSPVAVDLEFPTLLCDMPAPNVLAYPTETVVAEKLQAMVDLGRSNSRMKDFADIAMAARRVSFDGEVLVGAVRATFRCRQTPLPTGEIVALGDEFTTDQQALANWRAFAGRNKLESFESLAQVVSELRLFLLPVLEHARTGERFCARWKSGGPWMLDPKTEG
jgi:hypothetical protein